MIKLLGEKSTILALADLDQRIYEFRGASITRIPEYIAHFTCMRFDLGKENYRSTNTDIVQFGDDLLTGANKSKSYSDVLIQKYPITFYEPKISLKSSLSKSIERLKKIKPDGNWSIAILVKSKQETLAVSTYLSTITKLPRYFHEVLIDPAGPSLAANIIARILEPQPILQDNLNSIVLSICNHIKGRGNNKISQSDLKLAIALEKYIETGKVTGKNRLILISEVKSILDKRQKAILTGVPETDWLLTRKYFEDCTHEVLKDIAEDAKYLRLLNRGAVLSEKLSEVWRQHGQYLNATNLVEDALTLEHFSMTNRKWKGIFVMTIHKSKGKEFDEVIIWEEQYKPIVPDLASASRLQQDRLVLRVAVTRAKSKTTFLTPAVKPCVLI
jgi:DNA helicase-2/ATP-dependent DNA helicase PcrA